MSILHLKTIFDCNAHDQSKEHTYKKMLKLLLERRKTIISKSLWPGFKNSADSKHEHEEGAR